MSFQRLANDMPDEPKKFKDENSGFFNKFSKIK